MSKTTDAGATGAPLDQLLNIGAQMANVMFNLAQLPGERITYQQAETFDGLSKKWDAARRAAPSPQSASVDAIGQDDRALFEAWKGYALPQLNGDGQFDKDWLHREFVAFKAGLARAALTHPSVQGRQTQLTAPAELSRLLRECISQNVVPYPRDVLAACDALDRATALQAAPDTCQPSGAIGQAPTAEPEGWRAFIENCSRCGGGMVNGNRLAIVAKELLGAAPADPSRAAIDPEARDE